ncbi:MAG: polyprenyl synthetase family protein [Pseudomonadota bacterium]
MTSIVDKMESPESGSAAAALIEHALEAVMAAGTASPCPPRLAEAMRYAVFPGGHRIRPRLCMAVAAAHGGVREELIATALSSIELLHCASLVHDDMPCFDDAPLRRGKPAVHVAFGEALALMTGDALIVLAFQAIAKTAASAPRRSAQLLSIVSEAVGAPHGIVAGQAWECEPAVPLDEYQRAKTGVLFRAATLAGAAAAGDHDSSWGELGEVIGSAYQIADDLMDRVGDPALIGKPVGQDDRLDRPSAVREMGVKAATDLLRQRIEAAVEAVPDCRGKHRLKMMIHHEASRLLNNALNARRAA